MNPVFLIRKKIIEYMLVEKNQRLANLTLSQFANETASDSPAPGGGSVSAYVGALGASLSTMVANLSLHKKGYEDKYELFNEQAILGAKLIQTLIDLVDEDTLAFDAIMQAFRLPKTTVDEKKFVKKQFEKQPLAQSKSQ